MTSLIGVQKRSADFIMLVTIVRALPWRGIITGNYFAIETCGSVYLNKILDWGVRRTVRHCPTASITRVALTGRCRMNAKGIGQEGPRESSQRANHHRWKLSVDLAQKSRAGHAVRDSHSRWYNYRGRVSVRHILFYRRIMMRPFPQEQLCRCTVGLIFPLFVQLTMHLQQRAAAPGD